MPKRVEIAYPGKFIQACNEYIEDNELWERLASSLKEVYSEKLYGTIDFFDSLLEDNFSEKIYHREIERRVRDNLNERLSYRNPREVIEDVEVILPSKIKEFEESDLDRLDEKLDELLIPLRSLDKFSKNHYSLLANKYALEDGYKNNVELADELEISRQAVSKRIKRSLDHIRSNSLREFEELEEEYIEAIVAKEIPLTPELCQKIAERALEKG